MEKYKLVTLPLFLTFIMLLSIASISAITIKDVSTNPEEVSPGDSFEISIEIENVLKYDVENIHIQLDLSGDSPFAPYQSSSEKFLEELDSDDNQNFKFKLIVSPEAQSGIYKIPVNINYEYEENNSIEKDSKIGLVSVIINSEPDLSVSLEDATTIIKGQENKISIKIINSGLSDIKFLYLTPGDVSGIKFLNQKEQYIGDLDSDDFDSAEYNLYFSSTISNTVTIPLTLTFRDATNKNFEINKTLDLRVYNLEEAQKLGLIKKQNYTIYLIITIFILGYILYKIIKKRKKSAK